MTTRAEDSKQDAWADCPPGELSRMVERIHDSRRRRVTSQAAAAAVIVLVAAVTAWQFYPNTRDFSYGQITCTEIEAELQGYLAQQLPAERAEQFRLHLDRCPRCQRLLEQMGGVAAQPVADASRKERPHDWSPVSTRLMLAGGLGRL